MKNYKKLFLIPLFLIVISIGTSIIAFNYSSRLELGYLYQNHDQVDVVYEGEYFAVITGLGDVAYEIEAESLSDYLLLTIYDDEENIIKEYSIIIKIQNQNYDSSIITNILSQDRIIIDEMEDYLFEVYLNNNITYEFLVNEIENNLDDDSISVVLVNIPENLWNMKSLNESISFTTLVFSIISGVTILAIIYIRKDRD